MEIDPYDILALTIEQPVIPGRVLTLLQAFCEPGDANEYGDCLGDLVGGEDPNVPHHGGV